MQCRLPGCRRVRRHTGCRHLPRAYPSPRDPPPRDPGPDPAAPAQGPEAEDHGATDKPSEDACSQCGAEHDGTPGDGTASNCRLCPLCRGIGLLRSVRPETVDLLADLAMSVAATLRDVAVWSRTSDPASSPGRLPRARRHRPVRRSSTFL